MHEFRSHMYRGVTSRSYYADSRRQVQHRSLSPADIFKWAAILPSRPSSHVAPDALLLSLGFYFPFLSFPPPSTSSVRVRRASPLFRHAREPLISADFARRVDPWNPCSCLSPAPASRAGSSFHPSFSLFPSPSPSSSSLSSSLRFQLDASFFAVTLPRVRGRGFLFFFFFFYTKYVVVQILRVF